MISYDPSSIVHRDLHQILLSGVAPRPIAFVASQDAEGRTNLSPFSFFNAFGSKPPVVAIGPANSAATGKIKDTWLNIMETGECTISTVTHSIVQQMNVASAEYERGTDEFIKSGLSKSPSQVVQPPFVAESPFAMECRLIQNIELFREEGGNGNIMLLRVMRIHVKESVMTEGRIDPRKMDLVARMGYKWYAHITPEACFETAQPRVRGIGFDQLPEHIKHSIVLTGNDLAQLAGVETLPERDTTFARTEDINADSVDIELMAGNPMNALLVYVREAASAGINNPLTLHKIAQSFLAKGMVQEAWQTLLLE